MKAQVGDGDGTFYLGELMLGRSSPGRRRTSTSGIWTASSCSRGHSPCGWAMRRLPRPRSSYAVAPPGSVHTFSNPGGETVRALNIMAPGGFEQYLKEAAAAGASDPAELAAIAVRYDFKPV